MRTDIGIHIKTGDLAFLLDKEGVIYPFSWVSNSAGLSRYIYGEIEIPASLTLNTVYKGISCKIPYTAKYKEFYIRIKRLYGNGVSEYIQNPVDGSQWFLVKINDTNAWASELIKVSDSFEYTFVIEHGEAKVYSNDRTDFEIVKANRQNANLMLACSPTNNYRFPVSGVGLRSWVNSNSINNEMIDVLRNEFEADGTPVVFAEYDFDSKNLNLKLNTSGVD